MKCGTELDTDDGLLVCDLDRSHLSDPESVTHRDADGRRWSCVFDKESE